jgi:replicative DNA helicase
MSFIHSPDVAQSEIEMRMDGDKRLLTFGVDFLDEALEGILPNDLVLIGARSGAGKTQFCVNLALANVQQGKRVHYIALEAENLEIERRIKYRLFSKLFFEQKRKASHRISFKNWLLGRFAVELADLEAEAAEIFEKEVKGLFTFYKSGSFSVTNFIQMVLYCASETDLIIVDHVHYFDYEDDNENRAVKEIATTARDLALEQGKPIILVAHIRKGDKYSTDKCPQLEDFHGSSDLYKIATVSVTFAPGDNFTSDGKSETFMQVVKERLGGESLRHLACLTYNTREGVYEKGYRIGPWRQKRDAEFAEHPQGNLPTWAKSVARTSVNSLYGNNKPLQDRSQIKNWATSFRGVIKDD